MQDNWAPDRHQLLLDTGPLGCGVTGGHGHADLLSIQCSVFGEPYLVDAGTFVYTGDTASRAFFRGTTAHSTVTVDGQPQAVSTGPFRWAARPRATLRAWHSTPAADYADADHAAYADLAGGVRHRRRVASVRSRGWVIADDLSGHGPHTVDVRFQFAPLDVSLCGPARAVARGRTGGALLVQAFSTRTLDMAVRTGCDAPMEGWISDAYGRREPAPVLVCSTASSLPIRILTVLLPIGDVAAASQTLTPILDASGAPVGVCFADGERVWFDDTGVRIERPTDSPPPAP
jgi:hypothetical protein